MPWRKLKYWIPNPDRRKYHKLRETQSETPQYLTPSMTFPLQMNQLTSCRQGEAKNKMKNKMTNKSSEPMLTHCVTTQQQNSTEKSSGEINFMQTRRGDGKFNSTMKNGHQNYSPGNKYSNYSNYNNSDNFSKNWSLQQNRFNRRRLQRYIHQSRWPKHDIKFEYNSRDKNMMGNLRRTINYMKEGAQNREVARRLPKFVNRTIDKVSEDNIATISITEIQTILNEDIDLIFDALVIGDYIEDEEEV